MFWFDSIWFGSVFSNLHWSNIATSAVNYDFVNLIDPLDFRCLASFFKNLDIIGKLMKWNNVSASKRPTITMWVAMMQVHQVLFIRLLSFAVVFVINVSFFFHFSKNQWNFVFSFSHSLKTWIWTGHVCEMP